MFDKLVILGIVRHILTAVGGALATKGIIVTSDVEVIVGGVVALVGVIWSVVAKKTA